MAPQKPANKSHGGTTNGVRGARVQKKGRKHKVVLESAGNKDDDSLRVVLSFHAEPPPGYTFIPAGNTQLTKAMKDFAKTGAHQIMAVSATPHAQRHELSREVHRIGYHFPTEVVAQVCAHYGIRLDGSGRLIGEHDSERLFMKISQKGKVVLNENIRDQVTINTEAKEIIRDLFPKIPDNDLFQIIKTAFQLGDNKVGTAEEIPLVRRAQLSVVAHIRHSYTNYDKLLRQLNYNEARHSVEGPTLKKLVEWRGDDNEKNEETRKAVDDIVREVVVLSDEDSSESELEEGQVVENDNVKVAPSRKPVRPAVTTQHQPVAPDELSEDDVPQGYRYVPQPSRRYVAQAQPEVVLRQQQTRYAVWDQVRHAYHSGNPLPGSQQILARIPLDAAIPAKQEPPRREVVYKPLASTRYVVETPESVRVRQSSPPPLFRGADGRLYERMPPRSDQSIVPVSQLYDLPSHRSAPTQSLGRRSASPRSHRPQFHRRTPSLNDDGNVIPSIEPPDSAYKSPNTRQNPFQMFGHQTPIDRRASGRHTHLIDLTNSAQQASERMRISPSPTRSPFPSRDWRIDHDTDMGLEEMPTNRRQLIDLNHQIPASESTQRFSDSRPYQGDFPTSRSRMYEEQPLPKQLKMESEHSRHVLPQRQVVYGSVTRSNHYERPVRYVVEPPHTDPPRQRYYIADDQLSRLPAPGFAAHPQSQTGPGRRIILESTDPMDDVQRSTSVRHQPLYKNAYVQH